MSVVVQLSGSGRALIQREAEKSYPAECCGLLIGTGDNPVVVTKVVPAENQASTPDQFLIDPQCQFDWMRKLRGTSEKIIGHYHSHPNGRAAPSSFDRKMAIEAGQIWIILPVSDSTVGELLCFQALGSGEGFAAAELSAEAP